MCWSNFWVNFGYDVNEFFVANSTVSILISEINHLINLGCWEALSNTCRNSLEILGTECSTSWFVKFFKNGLKGCLIGRISSESEDYKEGSEINISDVAVAIDDVEDLSSLRL